MVMAAVPVPAVAANQLYKYPQPVRLSTETPGEPGWQLVYKLVFFVLSAGSIQVGVAVEVAVDWELRPAQAEIKAESVVLLRLVLLALRVVPPASLRLSIIHHLVSAIHRTRYFWPSRVSVKTRVVPTLSAVQVSLKFCILPTEASGAVIDRVFVPAVLDGELQAAVVLLDISKLVQFVPPTWILLPNSMSVPRTWV